MYYVIDKNKKCHGFFITTKSAYNKIKELTNNYRDENIYKIKPTSQFKMINK